MQQGHHSHMGSTQRAATRRKASTADLCRMALCPVPIRLWEAYTAGTAIYEDSLYGNLYVIPICYVESGI